jgi:hypothetical protein
MTFVQRILVDIHYILIGKLHFGFICLLFSPLVLDGFFYCIISLDAIFMSMLLNSFVIVLVGGP